MSKANVRASGAQGAVLLTGATGYLGTLVAAVLLGRERRRVVALVRKERQVADLAARIRLELDEDGPLRDEAELFGRLTTLVLPPMDRLAELVPELERVGVTEIVHCAGSLDYFNRAELELTNIQLTDRVLDLARRLRIARFIFISTAYSSGYVDGPVAERLHADPAKDPTEYARTKREAERLVAASGVPYLIIRPSVVIGHSRTGRYSGKPNGLYQYWTGWERLLLDHYRPETHMVAPLLPVDFVHQDAFQNAFQAAFTRLDHGAVFNLTGDTSKAPTVRALCNMWLAVIGPPERLYYYDHLSEVPLDRIHPRQRLFLMFASVNMGISAHRWEFETATMNRFKRDGLEFTDATADTMAVCQARFMNSSPRLRVAVERWTAAGSTSRAAIGD